MPVTETNRDPLNHRSFSLLLFPVTTIFTTIMSTRIEFIGQSFTGRDVTIDRNFPGILSDKMSNSEWLAFCNAIDKELAPLGPMKRRMQMTMRLTGLVWIVILVAIFIVVFVGIRSAKPLGFGWIYGSFAISVVPMLIQYRTLSAARAEASRIMGKMQSLLNAENDKRSGVSFHIRAENQYSVRSSRGGVSVVSTSYIECSVGSTGIPMGGGAATGFTTSTPAVATPVFASTFDNLMGGAPPASAPYSSGRSVAERLQELEGIKALISAEEYSSKKKSILDGI